VCHSQKIALLATGSCAQQTRTWARRQGRPQQQLVGVQHAAPWPAEQLAAPACCLVVREQPPTSCQSAAGGTDTLKVQQWLPATADAEDVQTVPVPACLQAPAATACGCATLGLTTCCLRGSL